VNYASVPTEQLILACVQTNAAHAWEEFVRRFNPLIARVAVRTAHRWGERSPSVFDDLVQETYLKLCAENCRLLRTFEASKPGALYGYLKVVTANVVHDHFKSARAAKRGAGEATEDIDVEEICASSAFQPSSSDQASIERTILFQEIDQLLSKSIPAEELSRSRLIFWLYYRSGLSASAIALLPNIHLTTKGVESVLLRLTRLVRAILTEQTNVRGKKQDMSQDQEGYRPAESF
jgi:RNA polymerase sigma-70 factor (ECF subfamily)